MSRVLTIPSVFGAKKEDDTKKPFEKKKAEVKPAFVKKEEKKEEQKPNAVGSFNSLYKKNEVKIEDNEPKKEIPNRKLDIPSVFGAKPAADNNLRKTVPVAKNKTFEVKKADPEPVKKIEKIEKTEEK